MHGLLFPPASAVEGIKSVPSVCVCVCQLSRDWTVWHTDPKFGMGVDTDNISDEFKGQGHSSKVKVARLKNVILEFLMGRHVQIHFVMTYNDMKCHGVTSRCHMTSRRDIMAPFDSFGREYWQGGHIAGGSVNAQAFSSWDWSNKSNIQVMRWWQQTRTGAQTDGRY